MTDVLGRRRWLQGLLVLAGVPLQPEPGPSGRRVVEITARRYQFEPEVIDVRHNDIVRLTIRSEDIAHSFTVDAYRIQKRVPPGGQVTFEFRADEIGRFPFYCSMRLDEGCRDMRGELIVR